MGTERIPALTALEDSAKPWRLEVDKILHLALNHLASPKFLSISQLAALRLVKALAGDSKSIEFRTGAIGAGPETVDGSTLNYAIKHNASGELEFFDTVSAKGLKVGSGGAVTVNGNTTFTGTVAGALPAGFPTILTGTLVHDPASIPAGSEADFTVTVTGAALGDPAVAGFSTEPGSLDFHAYARVTAANTVTVRYENNAASSVNLSSHTLRVIVFHY